MDKQHAINTEIYRRFAEEQIPFAFPTRTIYTRTEDQEREKDRKWNEIDKSNGDAERATEPRDDGSARQWSRGRG
jgi:small-conductance mechanosensitive channel